MSERTVEGIRCHDSEPEPIMSEETLCKALCEWVETHPGQMIMVREGFNYITGEPHYSAEVIEYGEWTPTTEKERVMNAYKQGREDGYDEGVMDLVEVDGYDEAFDNALRTINEVYEEETWKR